MFGFTYFALLKNGAKNECMYKKFHTLLQYQNSYKPHILQKNVALKSAEIHNLKKSCSSFKTSNLLCEIKYKTMPRSFVRSSNQIINEKIWNFSDMRVELCEIENKIKTKFDSRRINISLQESRKKEFIENVGSIYASLTTLQTIINKHVLFNNNNMNNTNLLNNCIKFDPQIINKLSVRNYSTIVDVNKEILKPKKRGRQPKNHEATKNIENLQTIISNNEVKLLANDNNNTIEQSSLNKFLTNAPFEQKPAEAIEETPVVNKLLQDSLIKPSPLNNVGIKELKKDFPNPKNALHNLYNTLEMQFKDKSYHLNPTYTAIKGKKSNSSWQCKYHLKWPEDVIFTSFANTKREASELCALEALNYLKANNKLHKHGKSHSIALEENETLKSESKHAKLHSICFSLNIINKLKNISAFYKADLEQLLVTNADQDAIVSSGEDFESKWPKNRKRNVNFLGLNHYLTKEPVFLPISDFKDEIIKTIQDNQVVIIKGEPGCGKSTRVPQYVLEGWAKEAANASNGIENCKIIVTQPRRIAALSLADRVSNERQEHVGPTVGYQVRLKSNFNHQTGNILFCTTGILLRRLQSDPELSDCSHIILDEAHERDVNTDLLMNLLRKAVKTNPHLKLIVMSATINTEMFREYFNQAPIVNIPGFTHPVKVSFLDHSKMLDKTMEMCETDMPNVVHDDVCKLVRFIHKTREEGAILVFLPGWDDIIKVRNLLEVNSSSEQVVLCLHSRLQDSEQRKIFSKPPPGIRKIILATNIAETSVTIDDVVYVIDTGIQKERRFDVEKGIDIIDNHWISKASMSQRKGRAGRCQPGESYHLYPKTKFDSFIDYSIPEIVRTSLTKIVLDSKVYSNNMKAIDFMNQLLTPPEESATLAAIDELIDLELLDSNENLTPLGRTLSNFQLEPKLGKAMVNSVIYKCVTPVVDIVTLFSSEMELFASGMVDKESVNRCKRSFSKNSDHLALMRLFEKWLNLEENNDRYMASQFSREHNLVGHKLNTIQKLRSIHYDYLSKGLNNVLPISDDYSDNDELVKGVLLSGVGTVLQHRNYDIVKGVTKKKNVLLTRNNHKATITSESVNFKRGVYPSDYLLYINETRSNIRRITVVRETSLISPLAVLLFKNNKLVIIDIPKAKFSEQIKSEDQVILKLENTKLEFAIDRSQAEVIKQCKEDLQTCYQYYIHQLTKGDDYNSVVNETWNEMLDILNGVLESSKIST